MKTDWEKYWGRYGDFFWKLGIWRKNAVYKHLLKNVDLKNPKILELGSGSGVNSLTVARTLNAKEITLVDFSEKALPISKTLVEESGMDLSMKYLKMDVRKLSLKQKFDIVHSDGLIEHFYGKDRISVFKKHVSFCRNGGFVIIITPYKSVQYSLLKLGYKILGRWMFDEEPFSRKELYELFEKFNLEILREYTSPLLHKTGILAKKV